jgi:hypothetical protein
MSNRLVSYIVGIALTASSYSANAASFVIDLTFSDPHASRWYTQTPEPEPIYAVYGKSPTLKATIEIGEFVKSDIYGAAFYTKDSQIYINGRESTQNGNFLYDLHGADIGDGSVTMDFSIFTPESPEFSSYFFFDFFIPFDLIRGSGPTDITQYIRYWTFSARSGPWPYPTHVEWRNLSGSIIKSGSIIAYAPEPSTWVMSIIGFGIIGFNMRRRRISEKRLSLR